MAVFIIPNSIYMFNGNITFLKKSYSMPDSGCSILEKSITAEEAE